MILCLQCYADDEAEEEQKKKKSVPVSKERNEPEEVETPPDQGEFFFFALIVVPHSNLFVSSARFVCTPYKILPRFSLSSHDDLASLEFAIASDLGLECKLLISSHSV